MLTGIRAGVPSSTVAHRRGPLRTVEYWLAISAPLSALLSRSEMGKKSFYAVKVGRGGPAIYRSWMECEAKVKRFSDAQFKGFATRTEAEEFIGGDARQDARHIAPPEEFIGGSAVLDVTPQSGFGAAPSASSSSLTVGVGADEIAVFTDGACARNQDVAVAKCPAGWGVVVVEGCLGIPPVGGDASAELYGPVDLDATSPLLPWCGGGIKQHRRTQCCLRGAALAHRARALHARRCHLLRL